MDVDEVVLTDTVRSKCFRMVSEGALREAVEERHAYWKDEYDCYVVAYFYFDNYGRKREVEILVEKEVVDGVERAVVITQHHKNL